MEALGMSKMSYIKEKNDRMLCNTSYSKSRQPNLEVVTVWYNRAEYVKESIGSLFKQTLDNFSILAVDDGSTDETGKLLKKMLEIADQKGIPMRVWRKQNEGFTISLKRAIEEKVTSKIIAIHDAGDISEPERLKTQIELLESDEKVVMAGANFERIGPKGEYLGKGCPTPVRPKANLKKGIIPRPGTHGAAMYYRDAYIKAGGYREAFIYAQDTDLWLRLINVGDFLNSEKVLYKKLETNKTIGSKSSWKKSVNQMICSAAAIQSARARESGRPDPINSIKMGDLKALKKIASKDILECRLLGLATYYLLNKKFLISMKVLGTIGVRVVFVLPKFCFRNLGNLFKRSNNKN